MKVTDSKSDWLTEEYGISRVRELLASNDDALIVVCKSGHCPALWYAISGAKAQGVATITFTGGPPDNALRQMGAVNIHEDEGDVAECLSTIFGAAQ